ncbi:MAG: Lipoate-protein ligase A subunit 1 [Candidatus Argoarchaeum ethanivorans]|uniref:Lipoate-protein ligase A subunit 1 n=1 Tax=Candidatus Argoarchaeum ethanivorans TaxID=2608793 RepID=A0A811T604_9EURY|nr:MAG: Lipoate-protein ligase A subunit 1 [Candidatus Argoarchaeum ethanivorans]
MKWRYLDIGLIDPYEAMAVHEAMFISHIEQKSPDTLYLERYTSKSVFLGYHQCAEAELNLNYCRENDVKVVRRSTGGGAGYMDSKQLNFEVVVDRKIHNIPSDFIASYERIMDGFIEALKYLGLDAEFKPINDLIVNGGKISGGCMARRDVTLLQHGSLLVDFDMDTAFKVLNVPTIKYESKGLKSAKSRVSWINKELGYDVDLDELKAAIKKGFEKSFGIEFEDSGLTPYEEELVQDLLPKYRSTEFIYRL